MKRVIALVVLVAVFALGIAGTASARGVVRGYRAALTELNGSGVTGMVAITKLPGQLKVSVWAYGLVPQKQHAQHIHGFADGTPAVLPGDAADTDHDGFVQLDEAVKYTGPVLLALTPYPKANPMRFYVFTTVYQGSALTQLDPFGTDLTRRVVMVHGGYWQTPYYGLRKYDALLPVAAGKIVMQSDNLGRKR